MTTRTKVILIVVAALALLIIGVVGGRAWRGYKADKEYEKYKKDQAAWNIERTRILTEADELKKRRAELEPQLLAYEAAAAQSKRLDAEKAKEIAELGRKEAENETIANQPTDCRTRAERICNMFRSTDKNFNCKPLFDQCSR